MAKTIKKTAPKAAKPKAAPAAAKKKAASKKTAAKKTGARKATVKKATVKKTTNKKVAAGKSAATGKAPGPAATRSKPAVRQIRADDRRRMIAEAAYLRGESLGFLSDEREDWAIAEAEVDARLAKAKIKVRD